MNNLNYAQKRKNLTHDCNAIKFNIQNENTINT